MCLQRGLDVQTCMCSTTVSSRALVSSPGQPSSPKSARQPLAWPGDTSAKTETALPGTAAGRWDSATRQQGRREAAFQDHLKLLPHFS